MPTTELQRDLPESVEAWGMLGVAISIAAEEHSGQTDKAGRPYIEHVIRVMQNCPMDPEIKTVGVLHDLVEDCPGWSLQRLKERGFSDRVCAGIDAMTKRAGESYEAFVARAGRDEIARHVKLADLRDNSNPARLSMLPDEQRARLEAKYSSAIEMLTKQGKSNEA
ncbi:HD domain-containing protein [Rhizobium leguminosarum]|uniref:HD domain-containing protein n=1 Tax=Rhizobium leguminosarum TaxID=384 RepID=UPI001FDED61B|nr:HD domain-containing protein [Rhizobium leguminosarum]